MREDEPFFVFADKTPITPYNARCCLKLALINSGFDPSLYCFHSLRAGRAVDLAKLNVPIPVIQRLGRWKSNAVYKYLKHW